ncbi:hypothetical protein CB1_000212006 [Camelus ferus]|nr:hypothetical protein CB1_000212006 [Camelus ferus]
MSGQTLTDRIAAAQYSVTGSAVARAVCKATTHEVMGPKKKHLDFDTLRDGPSQINKVAASGRARSAYPRAVSGLKNCNDGRAGLARSNTCREDLEDFVALI